MFSGYKRSFYWRLSTVVVLIGFTQAHETVCIWEVIKAVIKILILVRLFFIERQWSTNLKKLILIFCISKLCKDSSLEKLYSHCLTCSWHCKQTHGIFHILNYGETEMKAARALSVISQKKEDKTGNPLKTIIFVLASSGNFIFIHPVKKIFQTKSTLAKCQTCLGWMIIVRTISRGSCARMLTQSMEGRCPNMSVTVKGLLTCSWHLYSPFFGTSSNISCAKWRICSVNSF